MPDEIVNKVAASHLITLDLELLRPNGERVPLDIKERLYKGLILREKEFRDFVRTNDWEKYRGQHVAIFCSADAIVPTWAYMLMAVNLQPVAATVFFGSLERLEEELYVKKLNELDWSAYDGAKVVVKGCSKFNVPLSIYVEVAARLRGRAQSIMYGEPCSTVPLFKKRG
ncbi:MAG: DUF2480 family protein [Cyclobacteriaceae bacterium]